MLFGFTSEAWTRHRAVAGGYIVVVFLASGLAFVNE